MQLGSIMKSFGMPLDDLEISEMIREVGKKKDAKASAEVTETCFHLISIICGYVSVLSVDAY